MALFTDHAIDLGRIVDFSFGQVLVQIDVVSDAAGAAFSGGIVLGRSAGTVGAAGHDGGLAAERGVVVMPHLA